MNRTKQSTFLGQKRSMSNVLLFLIILIPYWHVADSISIESVYFLYDIPLKHVMKKNVEKT